MSLKNRLDKLEAVISRITQPYKLVRFRQDMNKAEALAIMEADRAAAELDGFRAIFTRVVDNGR